MIILSRKEVEKLTGAKQKKRQIKNLQENGFPFTIGVDGWPRVYIIDLTNQHSNKRSPNGPDFNWMI